MPVKVLIADGDHVTVNWLRAILEREGCAVDAVGTRSAVLQNIAQQVPDVLVLEPLLPDGDGLETVRQLRTIERTRGLRIIVLSTLGSAEDIAGSMNAGADDYILKRPGADLELVGKIRALSAQPKKVGSAEIPSRHGKMFSFCSAKGGTGTTSVCVNTAYALAKLEPAADILIVDMVFPIGTVGQSLDFASHKTVAKLTTEEQINPAVIGKYVSPRLKWGFQLLLGSNDPQEASELAVNQIVPMFDVLKKMYDYVLVDFGRTLSRISLPIMETSEGIVLILTPDTSTVRGSKLILQFFIEHDIPLEKVYVINNRTVGRVWTSTEDIERELGIKLKATIPYTVEYMTLAINAGVQFMERFPDNAATSTFTDVARQLQVRAKRIVS